VPRIRRFHPISHDFVRDREVQELRLKFGHWMTDVWLEMLSESDRNEGRVKGDHDSIARSLAWVSLSDRPATQVHKILMALSWMAHKGWISPGEGCVLINNYADYHPRREQASSLLPSLLPSLPPKDPPTLKEAPPSLNGWPPEWEQLKQRILTLPFFAKSPEHVAWVADLDWWKTQDEKFSGVVPGLDELLVDAVAFIETTSYKPRSRAGLRKKLSNCMEFSANKAERRQRAER